MLANRHALAKSGEKKRGRVPNQKKGGGNFQAKREIIKTNKMPHYYRFINIPYLTWAKSLN